MRKIYSLAVLLVMLLASTTVKAQDADFSNSVTVGYWDSNGYASTPINFSLEEVAAKLGITKEQLVTELEYSYPADEERGDWPASTIPFSSKMQDGTLYTGNYTADGCGYWMDANGEPCGYDGEGATCKIFDRLDWEGDYITIWVGRHPNLSTDGGTFTFFPTLTYGEKTVVFKIDYTYEARPVIENETTLSKLTMLPGTDVVLHQKPRSNYDADNVHVAVPTLLADLGFASQSELVMAEALYAQVYQYDGVSAMYQWADSITNERTTTGIGFWFGKTYEYPDLDEEAIENRTNLGRHEHGVECLFYAENVEFFRSEGADSLSLNIGQYPSVASDDGEDYHAVMYIVNGTLAYPIRINLIIDKVEKKDFADMECAGTTEVEIKLPAGEATCSTSYAVDNIAEILEALGEEVGDVAYYGLASEGEISTRTTANNGGSWFSAEGYVVAYGDTRDCYIEFDASKANWTVGTYTKNNHESGDEVHIKYYLLGRLKYWEFDVTVKYGGEETDYSTWTKVGTIAMTIQGVVPTEGYEITEKDGHIIPIDQVKELLGSNSFTLFGQKLIPATVEGETDKVTWSNSYSCADPEGHGFWMADNGVYVSSWGSWGDGGSSWAFSMVYSTGEVYMYNEPGRRQPGDMYKTTFYLANVAEETYVELPVIVKFVSSLVPIEVVGEQEVVVAWNPDDGGISLCYPDLEEAVNGVLDGDDSLVGSCNWYIEIDNEYQMKPDFGTDSEGCLFDADGKFICQLSDGDVYDEAYNTAAFGLGFDYVDFSFGVSSLNNLDTWVVSGVVKVNVAMEYEGKRWIFHCLVGDKETIETGISDIVANANGKKEVFDLTGRRVAAPAKGLYIINGKKVMVK
ncbi:MAG: DUF4859 domain-containing protein [Bacteroidaceae bacterium]|nr:DUF4859 domain-containing protein [Bacteroidaceae bacterium]